MVRIVWTLSAVLSLVGCTRQPPIAPAQADKLTRASTAGEPSPEVNDVANLLPDDGPTGADYPHLHNLLQLTGRIYSGSEPKDDQAFAELARLGVRTVVSVDGARPNVDAAKQHGLRYVHIPIGYDGIPDEAGKSLARLVKEADGPFYIHCHHGQHRGPAGAAIACIADGAADGKSALAILEKAGTSKGYVGLWRDVEAYMPPAEGAELPALVAIAEVGSLATAMAQVDRATDNLKLCQAVEWQPPVSHPDVAPAQQALLLKEGFRETVRQLRESNGYDEQFLGWMQEAEHSATLLESALEAGDAAAATKAFGAAQRQCQRCHSEYRD
jgi:hypothetical protein